jgi:hypothetical protein
MDVSSSSASDKAHIICRGPLNRCPGFVSRRSRLATTSNMVAQCSGRRPIAS